jgi:TolA-binding protein
MLGNALCDQGKHVDAEVVYREVLSKMREQLGVEHPTTLMSLGTVFSKPGKLDDAVATYQDLRTIQQRVLGAEHLSTINTTMDISDTLAT